MFRLIYRQRRRLLFGAFLISLAIFMMITTEKSFFIEKRFYVLTIITTIMICAALFITLSAVWLWLFPNWRFLIEQIALVFFVVQAFDALWPAHSALPYIGPFLPIATYFAIFMTAYGTALDRFPLSLGLKTTRKFISQKSPEDLWLELVPTPDTVSTHWDSLLHTLVADPTSPDTQLATYNHGASVFAVQTQTFTKMAPPHSATYEFGGKVSAANKSITGGTYSVALAPHAKGTLVTLTETHDALLPRAGLHMWFDDSLGDVTDNLRAHERGKRNWSLTRRYRRKAAQLS